jgi:monofunctional biosynthetic peptidoglycan transglycosylase
METRLSVMQNANPQAKLQHRWVPYENISKHLKRALVAS